jgi:hypothetical protein
MSLYDNLEKIRDDEVAGVQKKHSDLSKGEFTINSKERYLAD